MRAYRVACLILLGASLGSADDSPNQHFSRKADAVVDSYVNEHQFTGSVLVAKDGNAMYRKEFGFANREWEIPDAPDTKFRLGSITKQLAATAILQLAEQGKLRLDDPISKYYLVAPTAWDSKIYGSAGFL